MKHQQHELHRPGWMEHAHSWLWQHGQRQLTFWWQRRTRGFDDSELWSLDFTLCKWMAPRVRALATMTHGYPTDILYGEGVDSSTWTTFDALPPEEKEQREAAAFTEWQTILGKMARAMELWVETEMSLEPGSPEEREWKEGFELFHKYFFALWD